MIRCAWVGTNKMADGGIGDVEVGGVVAADGIHVGNDGFDLHVGVEVAEVGKGLFPCVKSMKDHK
jgi:hypothetical protein